MVLVVVLLQVMKSAMGLWVGGGGG
jgi:hypothetical protein